jgi:D-alanyl-D-alanine dipeptidase
MLNALLLEQTMQRHGFSGYKGEWWHFTDTDPYPVEETFLPTN